MQQFDQPLLVFGGAYSNLEALQALKQVAAELSVPASRILSTGDLIGYCANPDECLSLAREWGIRCIAGNVESQLAADEDNCGCNFKKGSRCEELSKSWFQYASESISETNREWLRTLPLYRFVMIGGRRTAIVHGSYSEQSEFIFPTTPWSRKRQECLDLDVTAVIGGHSGLPFVEERDGFLWLNTGALGMPANDGASTTWYALVTPGVKGFSVELKRLSYDFRKAAERMYKRGLPTEYADTLTSGWWCDVSLLPEGENASAAALAN